MSDDLPVGPTYLVVVLINVFRFVTAFGESCARRNRRHYRYRSRRRHQPASRATHRIRCPCPAILTTKLIEFWNSLSNNLSVGTIIDAYDEADVVEDTIRPHVPRNVDDVRVRRGKIKVMGEIPMTSLLVRMHYRRDKTWRSTQCIS